MLDTRSISLFSGAMGLDIGLMQAGIDIRIGLDAEPDCVETMRANGHRGVLEDIREISADSLLAATDLHPGEPFLICASHSQRLAKGLASMTREGVSSWTLSVLLERLALVSSSWRM